MNRRQWQVHRQGMRRVSLLVACAVAAGAYAGLSSFAVGSAGATTTCGGACGAGGTNLYIGGGYGGRNDYSATPGGGGSGGGGKLSVGSGYNVHGGRAYMNSSDYVVPGESSAHVRLP